jgi:deoxyhypusine synthase
MSHKSRFLREPVEPFAVDPAGSADDILARMERISFQGRNLATARRIWERMLADDCTIFLGTAGALSAGGMRLLIAHLIAHRYVDCLVSTGANLYHDLHETRGRRHYLGSPQRRRRGCCRPSRSTASTTRTRARTSSSRTTSGSPPSC